MSPSRLVLSKPFNETGTSLVAFANAALRPELMSVFNLSTDNSRKTHSDNPEILYKIKTGNYLPDELARANFSSLITALNFKSIAGIKADWWGSSNTGSLVKDACAEAQLPSFISFLDFFSTTTLSNSSGGLTEGRSRMVDTLTSQNLQSLLFAQAKQVRVLNN